MIYLVADQGNTRLKVALFDDRDMLAHKSFEVATAEVFRGFVEGVLSGRVIDAAMVSSTADFSFDVCEELRAMGVVRVEEFSHKSRIPLVNGYATPESLGQDRLLAAVAAYDKFRGEEIIIFDLGTAITIDYVTREGEYLGGSISPGMRMRFAALSHFTDRLPQISDKELEVMSENYAQGKVASSTKEALFYGVVEGIRYEIEGYIAQNAKKRVYFTGGDALYFEKLIKMSIFVDSQSTLKGLAVVVRDSLVE